MLSRNECRVLADRISARAVALLPWPRYSFFAAAKSVADLGRSNSQRRTSAHRLAGAFFVSATQRYGGCAWDTFGCAGSLCDRSANPRTVAPIRCLAATGDGSKHKGAIPMKPTRIPSALRARAHRAMALAALRSDTSLSNRLRRYNHHMEKARSLQAHASRAEAVASQCPVQVPTVQGGVA